MTVGKFFRHGHEAVYHAGHEYVRGEITTNPAEDYSDVAQVGYSLGTIALSGTPSGSHSVALRIDSTGQSGVATEWASATAARRRSG